MENDEPVKDNDEGWYRKKLKYNDVNIMTKKDNAVKDSDKCDDVDDDW